MPANRKKKLAIFYTKMRHSIMLIKHAASRGGFLPHLFQYKKIKLLLSAKKIELTINDLPLNNFSLIYMSNVFHFMHEAALVAEYAFYRKIPLIPRVLIEARHVPKTKIHNLFACALRGVAIPKTLFAADPENLQKILMHEFSFPLVAKRNTGSKGRHVHLIKSEQQLLKFLKTNIAVKEKLSTPTYIFQEFIPADSHTRVLIVGNKVLGAVRCHNKNPAEFRHNLALGGTASPAPVTAEMKQLAKSAKEAVGYEIAGVDLIQNKENGKWYILEINRTPEFKKFTKATGIGALSEIISLFLRFSQKSLKLGRAGRG